MGATQGITEWLPISSQGIILFINSLFNFDSKSLEEIFAISLALHLGTSFSAIFTYRKKLTQLLQNGLKNRNSNKESIFYLFSTMISLFISFPIYLLIPSLSSNVELLGVLGMIIIGFVYIINGAIQWFGKSVNISANNQYTFFNALIVGVFQGISIIPGMSRSGLTISALLLAKFDKSEALNISFILSIPVTIIAGIMGIYILSNDIYINLLAIFVAFAVGIATIRVLVKFTESVNFYNFILFIGFTLVFGGSVYLFYQ